MWSSHQLPLPLLLHRHLRSPPPPTHRLAAQWIDFLGIFQFFRFHCLDLVDFCISCSDRNFRIEIFLLVLQADYKESATLETDGINPWDTSTLNDLLKKINHLIANNCSWFNLFFPASWKLTLFEGALDNLGSLKQQCRTKQQRTRGVHSSDVLWNAYQTKIQMPCRNNLDSLNYNI
ncbi:unnamed protein product [Trifolium pratense]|uniref:Uncharacterized protein n=1 Tax=Trifolium pratense TaxID=57577 RepID=A0ACB0IQE0_TRIPR|nr:unnamed protein product [Trifolium pratense]